MVVVVVLVVVVGVFAKRTEVLGWSSLGQAVMIASLGALPAGDKTLWFLGVGAGIRGVSGLGGCYCPQEQAVSARKGLAMMRFRGVCPRLRVKVGLMWDAGRSSTGDTNETLLMPAARRTHSGSCRGRSAAASWQGLLGMIRVRVRVCSGLPFTSITNQSSVLLLLEPPIFASSHQTPSKRPHLTLNFHPTLFSTPDRPQTDPEEPLAESGGGNRRDAGPWPGRDGGHRRGYHGENRAKSILFKTKLIIN